LKLPSQEKKKINDIYIYLRLQVEYLKNSVFVNHEAYIEMC